MMHLAYPNILGATEFRGCGRLRSFPPGYQGQTPGYRLAGPNHRRIDEVLAAVEHFAPVGAGIYPPVYEQENGQNSLYFGASLHLAYLLAAIHWVRDLRFETIGFPGDIWCTGKITQNGQTFVLNKVDQVVFGTKLKQFLKVVQDEYQPGPASTDRVFLVPALNFAADPEYPTWCTAAGAAVLSLTALQNTLSSAVAPDQWPPKIIIKIRANELPQLVDVLFEPTPAPAEREQDSPPSVASPAPAVLSPPHFPETLPPVHNLPYLRNPDFHGRTSVLAALQAALTSGPPAMRTQVLQGLSGTGKTQLAVEYAYRYAYPQQYPVVWWVRAEDPTTLEADYRKLAERLALPEQAAREPARVVEAVRCWLEQSPNWLLIFDNVRSLADVEKYLPRGATGHVLITMSDRTGEGIGTAFPVGVFEPNEAVEFLQQRPVQADAEAAAALATELGNLPLALAQSRAYMKKGVPLAKYLELFRQRRRDLWANEDKPPPHAHDTVATTWSLAMEQIHQKSLEGAALLTLCAHLWPDDIPCDLFESWDASLLAAHTVQLADPFALNRAIAALGEYALVEVFPDRLNERLSVHRLVQFVVHDRLTDDERQTWAEAAVRLVATRFPAEAKVLADVQTWRTCDRLWPHALAAAAHAETLRVAPEATWALLTQAGQYLRVQGHFRAAQKALERVYALQEQRLGRQHPAVAHTLNNLAELYESQGQYPQAEQLAQRALEGLGLRPGTEPLEAAESWYILGMVYEEQGKYDAAESYYQQSLALRQRLLGEEHWQVAQCLNNLAKLLYTRGQYPNAAALHKAALAIRQQVLAPDHPDIAQSLHNLALVYTAQGQYADAVRRCQEALAMWQRTRGPEHPHPDVAAGLDLLGGLSLLQGQAKEAEALYHQAHEIWAQTLGPEHPTVAGGLVNRALLYWQRGDEASADTDLRRAIAIWRTQLGSRHPKTMHALKQYAALLRARKQEAKAVKLEAWLQAATAESPAAVAVHWSPNSDIHGDFPRQAPGNSHGEDAREQSNAHP